MRQQFDVGDIVEYNNQKGLIVERLPIGKVSPTDRKMHIEEYRCRVKFFDTPCSTAWVRAKWLTHISKINQ